PAEVDVDGERRPAQPGDGGGQRVRARAAAGHAPHEVGRALAGEGRPHGLPQLELLVVELEVHAVPLSHWAPDRAPPPLGVVGCVRRYVTVATDAGMSHVAGRRRRAARPVAVDRFPTLLLISREAGPPRCGCPRGEVGCTCSLVAGGRTAPPKPGTNAGGRAPPGPAGAGSGCGRRRGCGSVPASPSRPWRACASARPAATSWRWPRWRA